MELHGALIENSPVGVLIEDESRRLLSASERFCEMFGFEETPEELAGDDCLAAAGRCKHLFVDPEHFIERIEQTLREKRAIAGEQFRLVDGRVFERDYVPAFVGSDYHGHLWHYWDVTERERAKDELSVTAARLSSLIESLPSGILVEDDERNILHANREITQMFEMELSAEELVSAGCDTSARDVMELLAEPERFVRRIEETLAERRPVLGEEVRFADGRVSERDYVPIFVDSEYRGHLWHYREVTERKRAEEKLRENERRLRAVTDGAQVVLFALDREGVFTLSEGKGLEAMGLEPGEVVGQSVFEMYAHLPEVLDDVRGALSGEERASTVELGELTFATRYSPARDETGEVMGVIGVASDITDRRKLEKELEFQAFHDSLTGLPNRALFSDRLEHALDRCARRSDSISVLFLDLDDFKIINDTLGHIAGDWLLKAVAERLISCVRPEDTVARLGGDEFALLLEGTSRDGALLVAHRIERELAKPVIVEHDRRKISTNVSIGIVVEEAAGGEASSREGELLRMADLAMYRAKRNGKASHYVFDPTEDVPYLEAESLRRRGDELQRAIEQDELEVHYQCVVSLETGKVTGFEALVSWAHPERGLLPPDEFIPLAEESGLIGELSLWVLRHACQQVKWWREQNPEIATPRMSVNLSAKQLSHPGLVSEVATVLEEYSLEPSLLQLELTESATIEDPAAGSTIEEIKALGVSIAIDDFGTGYSSITYLTQFPADTVKIDRSIVANLESEEVRGEAVISAIVTLAHSLGDVVVAEGVENAGQLEHLRKLGCEFAQGFHLCPPYLAEEAFDFYRKRL